VPCVAQHINGDTGVSDEQMKEFEIALGVEDQNYILDLSEEDSFFSWSDCDGCRSGLGGNRYTVMVYLEEQCTGW